MSCRILGVVFLIGALFYVVYAFRAAIAHGLYYQAKYGALKDDLWKAASRCEIAHRLYPRNYYTCSYIAGRAYEEGRQRDGTVLDRHLAMSRKWCERGIPRLNAHDRSLRFTRVSLLAIESLPKAISYWEDYVEKNFWHPQNHAKLVELYSRAAMFEKAAESLSWTKGTEYDVEARWFFESEWNKLKQRPSLGP